MSKPVLLKVSSTSRQILYGSGCHWCGKSRRVWMPNKHLGKSGPMSRRGPSILPCESLFLHLLWEYRINSLRLEAEGSERRPINIDSVKFLRKCSDRSSGEWEASPRETELGTAYCSTLNLEKSTLQRDYLVTKVQANVKINVFDLCTEFVNWKWEETKYGSSRRK